MSNNYLAHGRGFLLPLVLLVSMAGCGDSAPTPLVGNPPPTGQGEAYRAYLARANRKANADEAIDRLKRIGVALEKYHAMYGCFPNQKGSPKGNSKLSWRVELLPFLEQQELYQQFKRDQKWNSNNNLKYMERMPDVYRDPRFQEKPPEGEELPSTTYFQVFTGKGGVFGVKDGLKLTDIANKNGAANTLLVVEAGAAVPWIKPDDLVDDPSKPLPRLGGLHGTEFFLAVFCDGTVRRIPTSTDEKTLRCMIQWDNETPFKLPWSE